MKEWGRGKGGGGLDIGIGGSMAGLLTVRKEEEEVGRWVGLGGIEN